jgi:Tetratricopeptide repeat
LTESAITVYGSDHPDVARDANNIGAILQTRRDLDGALGYAQRALKINEKVYGPEHPNVPSAPTISGKFSWPKETSFPALETAKNPNRTDG